MANIGHTGNRATKRMLYIARALALIWASWWTFFGLVSGAGEGLIGILANAPNALPGLVFLASAAIAWRWDAIGGVVLILEGLLVLIGYPVITHGRFPLSTIVPVLLTIALPPLVAGFLFLASWRKSRTGGLANRHPGSPVS